MYLNNKILNRVFLTVVIAILVGLAGTVAAENLRGSNLSGANSPYLTISGNVDQFNLTIENCPIEQVDTLIGIRHLTSFSLGDEAMLMEEGRPVVHDPGQIAPTIKLTVIRDSAGCWSAVATPD